MKILKLDFRKSFDEMATIIEYTTKLVQTISVENGGQLNLFDVDFRLQKWHSRWATEAPFNRSSMVHYQERDEIPKHLCNEFEDVIRRTEWIIRAELVRISFWVHGYDENIAFFNNESETYNHRRDLFPFLHDKGMLRVRMFDEVKGGDHGRSKSGHTTSQSL